jgi:two-component system nitrogen regulation response regulator NtrX
MADDILIVDDEADIRALVGGILQDEGFATRQSATTNAAWEEIAKRAPSLLILDIWLEGSQEDGIMFLKRVKNAYPDLPVVMISGHGNIETAVQAIQLGAYDFIEKPFNSDRLLLTVQRAIQNNKLSRENNELRRKSGTGANLIGKSNALIGLIDNLNKVGATNSRVLITGPAGSGKEVAARYIHQHSKRGSQPFIILNCATLRAQNLEEELFGWEDKAGKGDRKIGLLEQAHGGTLLLDEIADMPLETQAKMVRVLQDQKFERLGSLRPIEVDIRFMATSNRDLKQLIDAGRLRQDLYYRLNVVPVTIPPMRERLEDIPLLANHFIEQISSNAGIKPRQLGSDAMAVLQAHPWPGNVRQLRNLIEWLLIMLPNDGTESIRVQNLPTEFRSTAPAVTHLNRADEMMQLPLRDAREIFEREYLLAQIARFGGNISRTASFVEMERSALHRKLKLLDIASNKVEEEIAA